MALIGVGSPDTLPGVEYRRDSTGLIPQYILDEDVVPSHFPFARWVDQSTRYSNYWQHFKGDFLNTVVGTTDQGDPIYQFPLRINMLRNLTRVHNSLLFGKVRDTSKSLVQASARAASPFNGDQPAEEDKKLARTIENILNEIWDASNGAALQLENGGLTQFLGGCVFQALWQPFRRDLIIPIAIRSVPADFFVPIAWSTTNPFELLECYVIYRISAGEAAQLYQIDALGSGDYLTYVEYWRRDRYSIYLDGKPMTEKFGDASITYDNLPNPFGFIPIMYIPHLREGDWFGSSHQPDLVGLTDEYNGRMADSGDAIRETVHPERYMVDVPGSTQNVQLANGRWATDLGQTNPSTKTQPKVWREDPAPLSSDMARFPISVHQEYLRQGFISPIAFGEDEGSQRSGDTLAVRFWPSEAHASQERIYWSAGLNAFDAMLVEMVRIKAARIRNLGIAIPEDWRRRVKIGQKWSPIIPRDRKSEVDENILMKQASLKPTDEAVRDLGDSPDVEETVAKIKAEKEFEAKLSLAGKPGQQGAPQKTTVPVATSGVEE